jgi:PAS domain-containing protein
MDEVLAQVREVLERQRLVTQKRRAEEALQASEEQLQQIMDTVPEGVLLLDADRRISLANPAF